VIAPWAEQGVVVTDESGDGNRPPSDRPACVPPPRALATLDDARPRDYAVLGNRKDAGCSAVCAHSSRAQP